MITFVAILKFGGYSIMSYAVVKLANALREVATEDDKETPIQEIVKKPRLRR